MSTPPEIPPAPSATQLGLDADAAAYLERLRAAGAPPMYTLTPEQVRAGFAATAATVGHEGEPVAEVHDADADGVPVRVYRPEGAQGVVVYLHGGGWVVGTLDNYDHVCRALAASSGSTVVSVDYDLAPEARHPAAVLQGERALRWATGLPGGDRLAVAGDSAGGH
ncbi:MAG: alpha/beta hydrolase, partial [Actinomycetota bacterium]|nr:alpha/beta hydrolase [Actinomycetota bacterium]